MKKYHYPLILGGTAFLFLAAQPLISAQETGLEFSGLEELNSQKPKKPALEVLTNFQLSDTDSLSLENPSQISLDHLAPDLNFSELAKSDSIPKDLGKNPQDAENLIAQTPPLISQPEIIIQEQETQILQPTTSSSPPLPRAVAPPVGDIAVSNIDASSSYVDLGTNVIIPRLVLREAPVREVLGVLARYAGLNVVFLDQGQQGDAQQQPQDGKKQAAQTVSLDLENESVQDVFNSVLMISGMQANRRGKTVFVGEALPVAARNVISRTLRLNQVDVISASTYLAGQGAEYQRIVAGQVQDIVDPLTNRVVGRINLPAEFKPLTVAPSEGSNPSFLLDQLTVTADERLNSITLIGEPRQVEIATAMLIQLDARRRQVAVNVKVVDVRLIGSELYNTSFSFGFDDGFFVNDGGNAILNFGNTNPPNAAQTRSSVFAAPVIPLSSTIGGDATLTPFFDRQNAPFSNVTPGFQDFTGNVVPYSRPSFGTNNNPLQPGISDVTVDPTTGIITYQYDPPTLFQFPSKFLLNLEAQITSGNAKILTDPTLVVQEGQTATVKLTQKVIESVNTQVDPLSGVRTTTPVLADAGLTLSVNIQRIDDNGFVNLLVSPTVASPGPEVQFDSGGGANNTLTLLNRRELTSGLVRLRDGQTLILSGVISETERTTVSKVPILGDIPLLGALFRSTNNQGDRSEVIILVTPKIIDDNPDSSFGYNYSPGPEAAEVLKKQGFPVQPR